MSNSAKRNIQTILHTRASAELKVEVEKELKSEKPEASMASLLKVEEEDNATEQDNAESVCYQPSESDEWDNQDTSDGGDEEDR